MFLVLLPDGIKFSVPVLDMGASCLARFLKSNKTNIANDSTHTYALRFPYWAIIDDVCIQFNLCYIQVTEGVINRDNT